MYYPPYQPYYSSEAYNRAMIAKRDLRRNSNQLCWILLLAMFLMYAFTALCGVYLHAIGYTADNSFRGFSGYTPILYYLATGLGYVAGIAVPVLMYFAVKKIPLEDALPFEKPGLLKMAACVFFGAAVCMLANIPANMVANLEKAFQFNGELPSMPLTDDPWVLVLYGIVIAVIPPIVEELLFRGMILHSLRRFGDGFAVVASAILFGFYHGNFIQMVFAFIAGLVMGLVVVRTGSLWTSILIHFINNSISFAVEMVQRYGGDSAANQANYIIMGVVLFLGSLSLVWLTVKDRHFFRGDMPDPMLRMTDKLGAVFLNPGGIAVIAFTLVSSIRMMVG